MASTFTSCPTCEGDLDSNIKVQSQLQLNQWTNQDFFPVPYHTLLPPTLRHESGKLGVVTNNKQTDTSVIQPMLVMGVAYIHELRTSLKETVVEMVADEKAAFNQIGMTGMEWIEYCRHYLFSFGKNQLLDPRGISRTPLCLPTNTSEELDGHGPSCKVTMEWDPALLWLDTEGDRYDTTDLDMEEACVGHYAKIGFYVNDTKGRVLLFGMMLKEGEMEKHCHQLKSYRFGKEFSDFFMKDPLPTEEDTL